MLNRLFVYGSLRRSYTNMYASLLHESSSFLGNARMPGRLDQVGEYTGMMPALTADDWVDGELFELHEPCGILKQLDEYEGPSYPRAQRAATLADGQILECWVYLYLP